MSRGSIASSRRSSIASSVSGGDLDSLQGVPRGSENIQVFCRIRPLNKREIALSCGKAVKADEHSRVLLQNESKSTAYAFDGVLDEDTTQSDIFHRVGKPIADAVLRGFNGTVFAYGQTGESGQRAVPGSVA